MGKANGSRQCAPDDRLRVPTTHDEGFVMDGGHGAKSAFAHPTAAAHKRVRALTLTVLLLRNPRRLGLGSLGAGHANLIAIGDAIGWRDDDAVIGGNA